MHKGTENLKPCKPGETHNPNGRPKGSRNVKTVIDEILCGIDNSPDWSSPLIKGLVKIAFGKEVRDEDGKIIQKVSNDRDKISAIKEMFDRRSGKPMQTMDINNTDTSSPPAQIIINGKIVDGKD